MNILACLAILLGLIAGGLVVRLSMLHDSKTNEAAGWRIYARAVTEQGMEIVTHCEALERRNDWLESQRDHCKDVLAMSIAQSRIPMRDKTRMVAERMEYLSDYPR